MRTFRIEELLNNPKQYLAALERKLKQESKLQEYEDQLVVTREALQEKDTELTRLGRALGRGSLAENRHDKLAREINDEIEVLVKEEERLTGLVNGEKEKEQMLNSLEKLARVYRKKYKTISKQVKEQIVCLLIHRVTVYRNGRVIVEHRIPKLDDDSDDSDNQLSNHGGDAGN